MSSNPFRRSQQPTVSSPPPVIFPSGSPRIEDYQDAPSSSGRKKSVRITSPPTSPQPTGPDYQEALIERLRRGSHDGSPPPDPIEPSLDTIQQDDNIDPFDRELSDPEIVEEDEEVIQNTRRNSAPIEPATSTSKAPANPFSKTLANIEPSRSHPPVKEVQFDTKPTERTRASLDVDAFKRLLLTGSATPHVGAGTPGRSQPPLETLAENNSTAETSSISRYSAPEPVQPPRTESPSTPYDVSASEEERPYAAPEFKKPEKKKPPPPKHRHGKPVTSRTPQTVSFSDFSLSVNPANEPVTFPESPNTDLNKPLPPPPPPLTAYDAPLPTRDSPQSSPPASIMSPPPAPEPPNPKKVPPAPPLARRHSQLRSTQQHQNRSRSNSNLTISSQHSDTGSTSLPAAKPAPPPPPPTRRSGAGGSQTEPVSRASLQNPGSYSHNAGVPVPPPPRRGSSKSSFDGPRPSSEALAEARRESSDSRRLSLVRDQEDVVPVGGGVDVLAEMERLQAEVDALRGSYGRVVREG